MSKLVAVICLLGTVALLRADPTIENVQRTLKDQGFFYGEVSGENNADTSAAVRRFQIRHGLQVTGELNDETLRSIQESASASPPPTATTAPAPEPDTSDSDDDSPLESETPVPAQPFKAERQGQQPRNDQDSRGVSEPPAPVPPLASKTNLFVGTPYEKSSPEAQRNVVVSAQRALAKREVYKGQFDGLFGSNLEFSLRAYQSRVGLRVTGRLDLATLAALELLPGANQPVYTPRRPMRRPYSETPVQGEWIRE